MSASAIHDTLNLRYVGIIAVAVRALVNIALRHHPRGDVRGEVHLSLVPKPHGRVDVKVCWQDARAALDGGLRFADRRPRHVVDAAGGSKVADLSSRLVLKAHRAQRVKFLDNHRPFSSTSLCLDGGEGGVERRNGLFELTYDVAAVATPFLLKTPHGRDSVRTSKADRGRNLGVVQDHRPEPLPRRLRVDWDAGVAVVHHRVGDERREVLPKPLLLLLRFVIMSRTMQGLVLRAKVASEDSDR
mmetsp:Transcript_22300/g.44509  ORF Transcript_22300/g.44509 Transcript_22300/m.44509 type:complete len:244 (+) Transcript_22300:644-1375(+)